MRGSSAEERTVVVIPTYEEAGNVVAVIDQMRLSTPSVDILVVDDDSPDGTADLVAAHRDHVGARADAPGRVHLLQRSAKDGLGDWPLSRRLVPRAGNVYVRVVHGLPVHDTTARFKAFRVDALRALAATESASNGYCLQIGTTWRAGRLGLRVVEVPITFTDRTAGTSKMSRAVVTEALSRVLVSRWHEVVQGRRGVRPGAALTGRHGTSRHAAA
jgi:dolichol-phosphate mannosyltransferase